MFLSLRLLSWLFPIIVIGAPLVAVVLFSMAILGSPGSCEDEERPISDTLESAVAFQLKWDRLGDVLDAGQVSTFVFSESEVTSRARLWVDEHDVPVSDLFICFSTEGGAASGQVDVPFFPGDVDVLIRGTVDLRGERPEVQIDEIEVGSLPGPLANLVKSFIDALIDDQEEELGLDHDYGLAFGEGEVTISGQP
jgi:hypothetical protein